MNLISKTNLVTGTYYEVLATANLKNIAFQYKLIAGVANTVEIQFWGTVDVDASNSTDGDWINLTEFLTEEEECSVTNGTINDMSITDSQCPFAKVKVKYIITATTADNTIKVGWNSDK